MCYSPSSQQFDHFPHSLPTPSVICSGRWRLRLCVPTYFAMMVIVSCCCVLIANTASVDSPLPNVNGVEQELDTPITSTLPPVPAVSTRPDKILEGTTSQPIISSTSEAFYNLIYPPKKPSSSPTEKLVDGAERRKSKHNTIWSNSVNVLVTKQSWRTYTQFKQDTCRDNNETSIADRPLNNTESGYFTWEERMFHQELRKIILPETKDGSYRSVIGSPLLKTLDPKIFATPQQSLCRPEPIDFEMEAMTAQASHSFEDFLIDKVIFSRFSHTVLRGYSNTARSSSRVVPTGISSGNNVTTTPTSVTLSPIAVEEPRADEELMKIIK